MAWDPMNNHASIMVSLGEVFKQRADRKLVGLAGGGSSIDGVRNSREVVGEDVQGGREVVGEQLRRAETPMRRPSSSAS